MASNLLLNVFQSAALSSPSWEVVAYLFTEVYVDALKWYPAELPGKFVKDRCDLVPKSAILFVPNLASNKVLKSVDIAVPKSGICDAYIVNAASCAVTSDSVTV